MTSRTRAPSTPRRRRIDPWQPDGGEPGGWQGRYLRELAGCYEVLLAGTVGSGKTDPGLMGAVCYPEYRRSPAFKALILRYEGKDFPEEIYQRVIRPSYWPAYVGGRLNETKGIYRFKSGGRAVFKHTKDLRSLRGPEFQYLYPDELTHWPTPDDYLYALTRLRSAAGLPIRVRPSTNPGGPGHWWVRRRWAPWLSRMCWDDPDLADIGVQLTALGYAPRQPLADAIDQRPLPPLASGQVLHYVVDNTGAERYVRPGTPGALTRSCWRTRTADNAALMARDPGYAGRVLAAGAGKGGAVLLSQIADDDWDTEPGGDLFRREWFPVIRQQDLMDISPCDGVVRRWDLAYTAPDSAAARRKRDWTVGLKLGWRGPPEARTWYVLHVVRTQGKPAEVRSLIQQTAAVDGRQVPVLVPVDYAAGAWVVADVQGALPGYDVCGVKEQGAKEVRIRAIQPHVEGRRIVLAGAGATWLEPLLDEAAAYPGGKWDDQLDALAGAVTASLLETGASEAEVERDVAAAAKVSQALSRAHGGGDGWGDLGAGGWDAPQRCF